MALVMASEKVPNTKIVYLPMSCEILHPGHVRMIQEAAKYGRVIVGLQADEVIRFFKREFFMPYKDREFIVKSIKGVDEVIPQNEKDYESNLRRLNPDFLIHGKDWREDPLAETRKRVIEIMAEWGREVIEPDYTEDVSVAGVQNGVYEHVRWDRELTVGG